jgi:hypothetical protein
LGKIFYGVAYRFQKNEWEYSMNNSNQSNHNHRERYPDSSSPVGEVAFVYFL